MIINDDEQSHGEIQFQFSDDVYLIQYDVLLYNNAIRKEITSILIYDDYSKYDDLETKEAYYEKDEVVDYLADNFPIFLNPIENLITQEDYSAYLYHEIGVDGSLTLTDDIDEVQRETFTRIENINSTSLAGKWKSEINLTEPSVKTHYINTLTISSNNTLTGKFELTYTSNETPTSHTILYSGKYDNDKLYIAIDSITSGSSTITGNDNIVEIVNGFPEQVQMGIFRSNIRISETPPSGRDFYGFWEFGTFTDLNNQIQKPLFLNGSYKQYNFDFKIIMQEYNEMSVRAMYYVSPGNDPLYLGGGGEYSNSHLEFDITYINANILGSGEMRDENDISNYIQEIYNDTSLDSHSKSYSYFVHRGTDGILYMNIYETKGELKSFVCTFRKK